MRYLTDHPELRSGGPRQMVTIVAWDVGLEWAGLDGVTLTLSGDEIASLDCGDPLRYVPRVRIPPGAPGPAPPDERVWMLELDNGGGSGRRDLVAVRLVAGQWAVESLDLTVLYCGEDRCP